MDETRSEDFQKHLTAVQWLKQEVGNAYKRSDIDIGNRGDKTLITGGDFFLYQYHAKHKETLPYWDKYPVVFPMARPKAGHFHGINMHYLPLKYRTILMTALQKRLDKAKYRAAIFRNTIRKDEYQHIIKPAIKQYLTSNIRSFVVKVKREQWNMVLYLPLARFVKGKYNQAIPYQKVWRDSTRTIKESMNRIGKT